jgi:hypothetical protein
LSYRPVNGGRRYLLPPDSTWIPLRRSKRDQSARKRACRRNPIRSVGVGASAQPTSTRHHEPSAAWTDCLCVLFDFIHSRHRLPAIPRSPALHLDRCRAQSSWRSRSTQRSHHGLRWQTAPLVRLVLAAAQRHRRPPIQSRSQLEPLGITDSTACRRRSGLAIACRRDHQLPGRMHSRGSFRKRRRRRQDARAEYLQRHRVPRLKHDPEKCAAVSRLREALAEIVILA